MDAFPFLSSSSLTLCILRHIHITLAKLTLIFQSSQFSLLSSWIYSSEPQVLKKVVTLHLRILETKAKGESRYFTTSTWKHWLSCYLLEGLGEVLTTQLLSGRDENQTHLAN